MHPLLIVIMSIILAEFIFDKALDYLNLKNLSPELPSEANGIYDAEKYKKSQQYYRANHKFSSLTSFFILLVLLAMLFSGGFGMADDFIRQYISHPVLLALLYFGLIGMAYDILGIPFSLYKIFVIEDKFGFNKTTIRTFVTDKLKGYFLALTLGGGLLSLIVWIYLNSGEYFWLFAWGTLSFFTIFMAMFYTNLIVPIFNKLTPLPDGELRTAIEEYCRKNRFRLKNISVMDGSKRSTKSNAYFSGLGAKKKIVLFDTLIEKYSVEEIVAVLAHEVGHYKKKHTLIGTITGIIQTGITLFILSLFLGNPALSEALGAKNPGFHLEILAFGLLYSPISEVLGILQNILSSRHELQADAFAKKTFSGEALGSALKKLSADNLSNLKPHPAYVFVHYSHPPVLERLKALTD